MPIEDLMSHFAVALGIGLLIGIERGWQTREHQSGSRTAGIRTFAIIGLLGGTVGVMAETTGRPVGVPGAILLAVSFAAFAVTFVQMCRDENAADKTFSATTAIAGMLTFALSAYAMIGEMRVAVAAAVATVAILALRERIHAWLNLIHEREILSALILLAMTFIALPIIPNEPFGPFGGINPAEIWLIAIVLAGVSFVGYVAVKILGARHGTLLAAAAGGLVSSTAVTASNARRAAAGESSPQLLAAGVAVATAISFARVLVVAGVLKFELLRFLGPPLLAAILVAVVFAAVAAFWRSQPDLDSKETLFRNPFGFWSVVGFSVLLGAIVLAGRALGDTLGATGAIVGALALGLADVDAVTVSMSRLAPKPLAFQDAALAILAAVASNNVAKTLIGVVAGRGAFALEIAILTLLCLATGGIAYWLALSVDLSSLGLT